MSFFETLLRELPKSVSQEQFQALAVRLLSDGVICRQDSKVEEAAYDVARRILHLIEDYFRVTGYRLVHVDACQALLLYPPMSRIPGVQDDSRELCPGPRLRLSADAVAMALALKLLYLEGVNDARLDPEGEISVPYDSVTTALHTQVRRPPPKTMGEQHEVLVTLKRYRMIRFNPLEKGPHPDMLIVIRPR